MRHQVVWFDIPAEDLVRAVNFYSSVLSQKLEIIEIPGARLVVFPHETDEVAGCIYESQEDKPSAAGILLYFNVDGRLAEAVSEVVPAGGEILKDCHSIGEHGYRAVVLDSEGNRIGLHSN